MGANTGALMGRPKKIKPEEPKKPPGRPKSERDDIVVKFDRKLADVARLVAAKKGMTLAAYLSEAARMTIDADFDVLVRKAQSKTDR